MRDKVSDKVRAYLDETRYHRFPVDKILNKGLPYYGDNDRWMIEREWIMRHLRNLAEAGEVVRASDDKGRDCWVYLDALRAEEAHNLAVTGTVVERRAIARYTATSQEDLEHLANDEHSCVRRLVAANPSCPASTLVSLLGDEDEEVQALAGANPSLSEEYRELLKVLH